jgi:predicted porin
VTLSGGFGLALGQTKNGADNSGMQIARQTGNLNVSGVEDLGGGLKAAFALTTSIGGVATTNTDFTKTDVASVANRTILGDRGANVSLSGNFGTAFLGRGNTSVRNLWGAMGDVTGLPVVSGISDGAIGGGDSAARVIYGDTFTNYVAYVSPTFSGLRASIALIPSQAVANSEVILNAGDTAATKDSMSYTLQYAEGPLGAGLNYVDVAKTGGYTMTTLVASYDLGVAKFGYTYQDIKLNDGTQKPGAANVLTAVVPMGAGSISGGYGLRGSKLSVAGDDVKQSFIGYKYNLSKRTNVSLVYNKIDRAGTTADRTETHMVVGHTF